jgi:SARP family transcriptional regulator, regulator of embCAB operon
MLRFSVLGPLEIHGAKHHVRPRGALQRTLLLALLVNGGELVPTATLISELWRDRVPDRVENALQAHVSRLRRLLASLEPDSTASRVITHASGYQLIVGDDELDGTRFLSGLERQIKQRGLADPERAAGELRELLALWRGPVFGGLTGGVACRAAAARYEESRLSLMELLLEAELRNGRYTEIVPELRALLTKYSYKEKFWQQLMVALYRMGRRGDALRAYHELREHLTEELGLEPSPATRTYERAILTQNAGLMGSM